MKIKEMNPEHKRIIYRIRELYIQSGGKPLNKPEAYGLNETVKSGDGIEIDFDYGVPRRMYTPDGYYMILGGSLVGDRDKFWKLLNQEFDVEIVSPKRDDKKTKEFDLQTQVSGPVVRINEKNRKNISTIVERDTSKDDILIIEDVEKKKEKEEDLTPKYGNDRMKEVAGY